MEKTTIHIRVDEDLKEESERLFEAMGTSLSEAVRIFLKQCVLEQKMPFPIRGFSSKGGDSAYGFLSLYVKPIMREQEREAWISSLTKK